MSGKKRVFEFEQIVKTESAIQYLEQIVAGLKGGQIALASGETGVTLNPTETTKFTVEIKDSGFDKTLKMKLKWRGDASLVPTGTTLEIGQGT